MDLVEVVKGPRFKTATRALMKALRTYFRIEVVGVENIPRRGRVIVSPNHSGYAGFDAVLLGHIILRETGRIPRVMAHRAFFDFSSTIRQVSQSFGLHKASLKNGVEILKKNRLMILFPEGESGNFKPTRRAYKLSHFHTGFVRMAIQSQSTIVPCVIIGAEESHINLGNIDVGKGLDKGLSRLGLDRLGALGKLALTGLKIPLPVNLIPLPAKWRIVFLKPVTLEAREYTEQEIERLAHRIQKQVQKGIHDELKRRPYIYTKASRKLLSKALESKRKLSKLKREARKIRRAARIKVKAKARKARST
jgi:1-acyl-sn-glycerol-3-phosphate acyltransferase